MRVRAAIAEAIRQPFVIEELELDEPMGDEVLVRLVAPGICQTDAHVRNGHLPTPMPIVLGHEGAGIVEGVGPAVTELRRGDHVVLSYLACGHCRQCFGGHGAYCAHALAANFSGSRLDGTRGLHRVGANQSPVFGHFFGQSSFATYALATQRNAVKVDDAAPLELLPPLGCGLQTGAGAILNSLAARAGDSVAILGVGAVGFGALLAARMAGAATIIAVDVNPQRLALARELGATHTVDAHQADVADAIRRVRPEGVSHVLDTTGRADMLKHAVASLSPLGRVGLVAGAAKDAAVSAESLAFGKSVRGIVQGDAVPHLFIPLLVQAYLSGRFPIDRLVRFYDFEDIDAAFAAAAQGDVVKPVLRFETTTTAQKEKTP